MDYRSITRFLGFIMLFIAILMLVPLAIAHAYGEEASYAGFLKTIILMLLVSLAAILSTLSRRGMNIGSKEAVLVVTLTWIVMTAFGALPMYLSGAMDSYAECFFEIMSGFTTAGSTILSDIESLDMSILFWRSLTNWLGGMGVVILFVAVLPIFGVKGNALVGAEAVGPSKSKLTPTIRGTAMALWLIYIGLSVAETLLLLLGGLDWFNALTVMFGTIGAAGFAPISASIAGYHSAYVEWVCIVFMLLAGINFSIFFFLVRGQFRKASSNSELRLYLAFIAISSLVYLIAIRLSIAPLMTWHYARENAESLRQIREELRVLAAQGATAPKPAPHPIPKTTYTPLTPPPMPPSDDVTVSCPACGAKVAVRKENLGKHVSCPLCGQRFILD